MVLKQEVLNAFKILGVTPEDSQSEASKAYKKLALHHHPDRNYGSTTANARFQEIGHAWEVVQKHYEYPGWSEQVQNGPGFTFHFHPYAPSSYFDEDDDEPLSEDEAFIFFQFLFRETMMRGHFSHAKQQRYKQERRGDFDHGHFSQSKRAQTENTNTTRENEEFANRVRQFERECAKEEAERTRKLREEIANADRVTSAYSRAFDLAKAGDGAALQEIIGTWNLDILAQRPTKKKDRPAVGSGFTTLLHLAAGHCNIVTVQFLLARGADLTSLDASKLTPFQYAVSKGNLPVVEHLATHYTKADGGCHPSKAVDDKDKSTPLQLAISSGHVPTVQYIVKFAPVPDVTKCWNRLVDNKGNTLHEIRNILLTKNGFVPPPEGNSMSQKALKKLQQREEERLAAEAKAKRIAEAEENRRKNAQVAKEAEQRREEEVARLREQARLQRDADNKKRQREYQEEQRQLAAEHQRQEEAEVERTRMIQEAAERETHERQLAAERLHKEAVAAKKAEMARERKALEARKAEEDRIIQEAAVRAQETAEEEARERLLAAERQRKEVAAAKKVEMAHEKKSKKAADKVEDRRCIEETAPRTQWEVEEKKAQLPAKRDGGLRQEKGASKQDARAVDLTRVEAAATKKLEAQMRRRREQSERDKASHNRRREEARLKAINAEPNVQPSFMPPPGLPPPAPRHFNVASAAPVHPLYSPPMGAMSIQTVEIPTELFAREIPPRREVLPPTPEPTPSPRASRKQITGNRSLAVTESAQSSTHSEAPKPKLTCRFFQTAGGCKRGDACRFLHIPGKPSAPKPPRSAAKAGQKTPAVK